MTVQLDVPLLEPIGFRAGDTVHWQRDLTDTYPPADGWTLKYICVTAGDQKILTATVIGTIYDIVIASNISAGFKTARYHWQAYVTNGLSSPNEVRYTIGEGDFDVTENLQADSTGYDPRTTVKQLLDAVEAMLLNKASADQQEYTIHGRMLKRYTFTELVLFRDRLKLEYGREVNADRIAQGLGTKNRILTRFSR